MSKNTELTNRLDRAIGSLLKHQGSWYDIDERLEHAADLAFKLKQKGLQRYAKNALKFVADEKNLYAALMHLMWKGGDTPGPDGITQETFSNKSERFDFCRAIRNDIKDQFYTPGLTREIEIPKSSGKGYRTIVIPNLGDKVVDRGIKQVLEPILDNFFVPWSFGFRRKRNRGDAIAKAVRVSEAQERFIWVCADIKNAFDNVPLKPLMDMIKQIFPADNILNLIQLCLRVSERSYGVPQGSPLSPLMLNLFLHNQLDLIWEKRMPEHLMVRYADDILVMCKSETHAHKAIETLDEILNEVGMSRKKSEGSTIIDFKDGDNTIMLGFDVSLKSERFVVKVGRESLNRFKDKLLGLEYNKLAPKIALTMLEGWFNEQGPTYSKNYSGKTIREIVGCLKQIDIAHIEVELDWGMAIRLGSQKEWMQIWKMAHSRWKDRCK